MKGPLDLPNPVGTATRSKTEHTTDHESKVESWATANNIGGDTPEGGTDAETHEQRTSSKTNVVLVNAEFQRQLR
jgi:hypothetical protein